LILSKKIDCCELNISCVTHVLLIGKEVVPNSKIVAQV